MDAGGAPVPLELGGGGNDASALSQSLLVLAVAGAALCVAALCKDRRTASCAPQAPLPPPGAAAKDE